MRRWLLALELARDEEARAAGIDGIELADAIVASARFSQQTNLSVCAALTGDACALEERIARLLEPLREPRGTCGNVYGSLLMTSSLLMAVALGSVFGERVVRALFLMVA